MYPSQIRFGSLIFEHIHVAFKIVFVVIATDNNDFIKSTFIA